MSKPGGCHSSGISLGDALRLPKRHPAWRRREAQSKVLRSSDKTKGLPSGIGPAWFLPLSILPTTLRRLRRWKAPWASFGPLFIGSLAGVIAKFLHPGPNEPSGFILTTVLGIVGALVATFLGQAIGWYEAGEGAGLIGATIGAIIVLVIWGCSHGAVHKAFERVAGDGMNTAYDETE